MNVPRPPGGGGGGGRGRAPRPDLVLTWSLHRGPADVAFAKEKPDIDKAADGAGQELDVLPPFAGG